MTQQLLTRSASEQKTDAEPSVEKITQEKKEKVDIGAAVMGVNEYGVTVETTKEIMRAEASLIRENGEEQKVMDFSEEKESHRHVVPFEETVYAQFKVSPWELVNTCLEEDTTGVETPHSLSMWGIITQLHTPLSPVTASDTVPAIPSPPVEEEEHPQPRETLTYTAFRLPETPAQGHKTPTRTAYTEEAISPNAPSTADTDTFSDYNPNEQYGANPAVYEEQSPLLSIDQYLPEDGADLTVVAETSSESEQYAEDIVVLEQLEDHDVYDTMETADVLTHVSYDGDSDVGLREQISYTVSADTRGNAAESVQELLERTPLSGSVETMTYEDMEDNYKTKEAYWADIDGMDMTRTEFFINGELAEDSLDKYDLEAGDTITFVEADLFDSDSGGSCGGSLYLDDVLEEYEDSDKTATVNTYGSEWDAERPYGSDVSAGHSMMRTA